ncbi:hypothetical protein K5I29_01535 [Flavobacterium agricola]|uniref:Prenyltransferase n=1 Tax=Flavobacterium agricola TaxID=2870839 RepID=A0ABY6LZH5_9FLAO|nr:hypothetical protein [Flavobacterium agricola]UYW01634.1 hypothetical protein K5I29_01535 [Flavobacterium agricola]
MKTVLKNIFDFYINASIHVGFATLSLVLLTYYFSHLKISYAVCGLVFFGTIFSYNFIKYYSVFYSRQKQKKSVYYILALSVLSMLLAGLCFLLLNRTTQIIALLFGALTLLYAIPVGKLKKNLRNLSGIKIYIVSFCWAGATLLLPLLNADYVLNTDVLAKFIQRFIITLLLILIFEIKDLEVDDPNLKTFPQIFGVLKTKLFIVLLCIPFYVLEFFKTGYYANQWLVNLILVAVIITFTYFVNPNRNKYFTLFWVEAVPILWLFLSLSIN